VRALIRNLTASLVGAVLYLFAPLIVFVLLLVFMKPFDKYHKESTTLEYVSYYLNECHHCWGFPLGWQVLMFGICSLFVVAIAFGISRAMTSRGLLVGTLLILPSTILGGVIPLTESAWTTAGKWPFWFNSVAALPLAFIGSWWGSRAPPNKSLERTREG
jgi:hypothetical protein